MRDPRSAPSAAPKLQAVVPYVEAVLLYSNQRLEVIRSQLLTMAFLLFNQTSKRQPVRKEARDIFINILVRHLEDSRTVEQAVNRCNATFKHLRALSQREWQGPSEVLLEMMLEHIREHFEQELTLPIMAQKFGASIPVFTKVFKQATGASFLSYLRSVRIERAKILLTTTRFNLVQVAGAVGYHSPHQLIHAFKTVTKQTPGAYRKRNTPHSVVGSPA